LQIKVLEDKQKDFQCEEFSRKAKTGEDNHSYFAFGIT
jgi:hypothetical protein